MGRARGEACPMPAWMSPGPLPASPPGARRRGKGCEPSRWCFHLWRPGPAYLSFLLRLTVLTLRAPSPKQEARGDRDVPPGSPGRGTEEVAHGACNSPRGLENPVVCPWPRVSSRRVGQGNRPARGRNREGNVASEPCNTQNYPGRNCFPPPADFPQITPRV